jgi:two-component system, LytTR family, sensor kinase
MKRIFKGSLWAYMGWWAFWFAAWSIVVHRFESSWRNALIDAAVSTLAMMIGGIIISNTFKFYRPGGSNYFFRAVYIFILTLLVSVISNLGLDLVFQFLVDDNYRGFVIHSGPVRFVLILLMMSFMGAINWLVYYIAELQAAGTRKQETEKLMRDAELTRLRQQLQPHFLFNSLNSISALAGSRPEEARKMVQQLSDFLRGTLRTDEYKMSDLSEELKHISLYLEIEKVRFGHRLKTVVINETEHLPEVKLPALILQPILENTIKYGLYDVLEDVTIVLKARVGDDGLLLIEVSNPYDPESKISSGTGFGLKYLERRLYLLYGRNDLLSASGKDGTFVTQIRIPQIS